jgi:lysozyme family protein
LNTVDEIANGIVRREGGFVNDPDDPGGATNHGVTIHTMRRLGLDLTKDGRVTVSDVRKLSRRQAVEIFKRHYFHSPKINQLPEVLQASVFDMQVNAGGNAIKILQRLLNQMGFAVSVDGALGRQSISAAIMAAKAAPDHIADAYGIERRNYYYALADGRAASRKYAKTRAGGKGGWIKRSEEFISKRFHFTATQHKERILKWD